MKKKVKKSVKNRYNPLIKIFVISIIFGLLMILFMLLYSKYYYVIPLGWMRFFISNLTMLIPVIVITIVGFLFNLPGGSISDFMFYLISFIIYFLLSFGLLYLYRKIKPSKRKKYKIIFFSILAFYIIASTIFRTWGLYH